MQKLTINFSLRFSRTGKDKASIVCYVTVDGVRATPFSTKISCLSKLWNGDKQEIIGMDAENETLATIKQHLRIIFNTFVSTGQAISAEKVKQMYLCGTKPEKTLVLFCSEWLKTKKSLISSKLVSQGSIRAYGNYIKNINDYLAYSKQQNILLADVNELFVNQLSHYLITVPKRIYRGQEKIGFVPEYVEKIAIFLKRLIKEAHASEEIKKNSLFYFKSNLPKTEKPLVFLEIDELHRLKSYKFSSETSQRVVDLFIFQCYTGFAYSDIYKFKPQEHTILGHDGKIWIWKDREKTGKEALLPFFKEARLIWEKYGGKMPVYTNNNYNDYLRDAVVPLEFGKYLTTHCGRKTAAMLFLEHNCDFDTVAKMVGHANAKMTKKHYAKVRTQRIAEQLKGLEW